MVANALSSRAADSASTGGVAAKRCVTASWRFRSLSVAWAVLGASKVVALVSARDGEVDAWPLAAACGELLLAAWLLTGVSSRAATATAAGIALLFLVISAIWPEFGAASDGTCRCLGLMKLDAVQRQWIASGMLAWSALALSHRVEAPIDRT